MKIEVSKRSILSFLLLIVTLRFTVFLWVSYLLPGFIEIISLKPGITEFHHFALVWVPIVSCLMVGINLALAVNVFKRLNDCGEKGLLSILLNGFIGGTIASAIIGGSDIWDFVTGFALIVPYGVALLIAIVWGLVEEFS